MENSKNEIILEWKRNIQQNDKWALRAFLRIWKEQTEEEKQTGTAENENKVGFSKYDARIASSFFSGYSKYGSLTPKQYVTLKKIMPKYAGQLYRLTQVEGNEEKTVRKEPVKQPQSPTKEDLELEIEAYISSSAT